MTDNETTVVNTKVVIASKLLERWMEFGDHGRSPGEFGREVSEESSGDGVRGVGRIPGGG